MLNWLHPRCHQHTFQVRNCYLIHFCPTIHDFIYANNIKLRTARINNKNIEFGPVNGLQTYLKPDDANNIEIGPANRNSAALLPAKITISNGKALHIGINVRLTTFLEDIISKILPK